MIAHPSTLLPDHPLLNLHRRWLGVQPNLTGLPPLAAQRLMFTSLFDLLATSAPFVPMDELIEVVLVESIDAALDPEPHELCGTPLDVLTWVWGPHRNDDRQYSLRLVQYLGALLDRYGHPANPPHLVGVLQTMMDFLPEPSVLDIDFGEAVNRFSPSAIGRCHLGWTGVVCLPAGPFR